jgi:transposase
MGAIAVIPPKRNRIERCFSRLKHFRRFATRYEKNKSSFQALVALSCSLLHLQLYVDTT